MSPNNNTPDSQIISYRHLTDEALDLLKYPNLQQLTVDNCGLRGMLDLSCCPNLKYVSCKNNLLIDLYIDCPELEFLDCSNNLLEKLDLEDCDNLRTIICFNNLIQEFLMPDEVVYVNCNFNRLDNLDIPATETLQTLMCATNHIVELETENMPNLQYLDCSGNKIEILDLGSHSELTTLYCWDNELRELITHPYILQVNHSFNSLCQVSETRFIRFEEVEC
jgi:Leucine-rich repeat (LRR) protein